MWLCISVAFVVIVLIAGRIHSFRLDKVHEIKLMLEHGIVPRDFDVRKLTARSERKADRFANNVFLVGMGSKPSNNT